MTRRGAVSRVYGESERRVLCTDKCRSIVCRVNAASLLFAVPASGYSEVDAFDESRIQAQRKDLRERRVASQSVERELETAARFCEYFPFDYCKTDLKEKIAPQCFMRN